MTVRINNIIEYDYAVSRGFVPLMDLKFILPIKLRVQIQNKIFGRVAIGKGNILKANQRFYEWVWHKKPKFCEETMRPLYQYSAVHISHILSRGAYPEMAHDPRNTNLFSFHAHQMWEDSTKRKQMRIYKENMNRVEMLINEYQNL